MRRLAHKLGHFCWWLAFQLDPENTPTYRYCECRSDPRQGDTW